MTFKLSIQPKVQVQQHSETEPSDGELCHFYEDKSPASPGIPPQPQNTGNNEKQSRKGKTN
eukprot:6383399-Amphidinium_carterae.1